MSPCYRVVIPATGVAGDDAAARATLVKAGPVVTGTMPIDRAISTARG